MSYPDSYDDHQDYKRQEELSRKFYQDQLERHPVCGDPLHPGCILCDQWQDDTKPNTIDAPNEASRK